MLRHWQLQKVLEKTLPPVNQPSRVPGRIVDDERFYVMRDTWQQRLSQLSELNCIFFTMEVLSLQLIVTTFLSLSQGCAFHRRSMSSSTQALCN